MTASVLITGASGGFGCEFARRLEALGYRLLLHGRDTARLQLTLDALQHRQRHRCLTYDLADAEAVEHLIAEVREEKNLAGLVNNAGFGVWGSFAHSEIIPQLQVIQTDLLAPVHLTHALLPRLIKARGFVINVSSLAGETPLPYMATYAAAKAGLTYWSEAMRAEMKDAGLRVVTLAPGPSPTGFRDVSGMPAGKGALFRTAATVVVDAALRCLARGGGYCVPGPRHAMLFAVQKVLPRRLKLAVLSRHLHR